MTARLRLGVQARRLAPEGRGASSWTRSGLALAILAFTASNVTTAASGQVAETATPDLVASPTPDLDPPLNHIPLSSLKATRERPLFSPSRRPALEASAEPPPEPAPPPPPAPTPSISRPNLTLVGTVTSGKQRFAIFTDAATQDTVRLRMGEAREGWTLASIDKRTATLTNGDQAFTVEFPANADVSEAPQQPAADDDEMAVPAWQARHQAQAAASDETPPRPPPASAPTQVQPPPPSPILRRKFHP